MTKINKEELIDVMAQALGLSRRRFPNKYNATYPGCDVKPTAEQLRDAETVLDALIEELPECPVMPLLDGLDGTPFTLWHQLKDLNKPKCKECNDTGLINNTNCCNCMIKKGVR